MQLPPLDVLASWPPRNHVDPVLRGNANIVLDAVLLPLVLIAVGIRMYTRVRISSSFGLDDFFILISLFPTLAFAVSGLVLEYYYQWNRHEWDIPWNINGLKVIWAAEIFFVAATTFIKFSMLTLTFRIMGSKSRLGPILTAVGAFMAAEALTFCFLIAFQCRHPSDYWKLSFEPQQCLSQSYILLAGGICNNITDLLVVLLPIPTVWGLQLPMRETIIIVILFGAGFMVTIAGAVRTYYTYEITNVYDQTWYIYPVWITSSLELYVGIICACAPATKRFFTLKMPYFFPAHPQSESTISSNDPNNYYYYPSPSARNSVLSNPPSPSKAVASPPQVYAMRTALDSSTTVNTAGSTLRSPDLEKNYGNRARAYSTDLTLVDTESAGNNGIFTWTDFGKKSVLKTSIDEESSEEFPKQMDDG